MIEESGRVVAVDKGAVWVETHRSSTCSGCSARNGCGQALMNRLGDSSRQIKMLRAISGIQLCVGDFVIVGVHEDVLLRGAVLVYLVPLLSLMGAAFIASFFSLGEPYVITAGLVGFLSACALVRAQARRGAADPRIQPVVLRTTLATGAGLFQRGDDAQGSIR
ncbi:SoxR reducing system RseC family protein [Stutzerimonas chloritidismutans]|uniref:SoxR reducing system RseC family protein n=1 Tax=Stutzerimonas chloritidismutans TaxID=203192 RepID=UPI003F142437